MRPSLLALGLAALLSSCTGGQKVDRDEMSFLPNLSSQFHTPYVQLKGNGYVVLEGQGCKGTVFRFEQPEGFAFQGGQQVAEGFYDLLIPGQLVARPTTPLGENEIRVVSFGGRVKAVPDTRTLCVLTATSYSTK